VVLDAELQAALLLFWETCKPRVIFYVVNVDVIHLARVNKVRQSAQVEFRIQVDAVAKDVDFLRYVDAVPHSPMSDGLPREYVELFAPIGFGQLRRYLALLRSESQRVLDVVW
jgi:hypothetical protein